MKNFIKLSEKEQEETAPILEPTPFTITNALFYAIMRDLNTFDFKDIVNRSNTDYKYGKENLMNKINFDVCRYFDNIASRYKNCESNFSRQNMLDEYPYNISSEHLKYIIETYLKSSPTISKPLRDIDSIIEFVVNSQPLSSSSYEPCEEIEKTSYKLSPTEFDAFEKALEENSIENFVSNEPQRDTVSNSEKPLDMRQFHVNIPSDVKQEDVAEYIKKQVSITFPTSQ